VDPVLARALQPPEGTDTEIDGIVEKFE